MDIFNWLLKSNFFNFLILVFLMCWLFSKLNVTEKLNEAKNKIEKMLSDSDNERLQSVYTLAEAEDAVKSLPEELAKIQESAKETIISFEQTAQKEIQETKQTIENNAEKIIDNEKQKIAINLQKETAQRAVDNARTKLKQKLSENDELQRKLIAEAINKIEEINI